MALTPIDQAEAVYNCRDVLSMCRMWPHLVDTLERNDVVEVYNIDEQLADLALQMTRIGMPVNSGRRQEIGDRLKTLREKALAELQVYTEGEHRAVFVDWVASFFAKKARKGEPVDGAMIVGPSRAAAALAEAQATLKDWRAYRKVCTPEMANEIAEADTHISNLEVLVKTAKADVRNAQFIGDEMDGLAYTADRAYEVRMAIRRQQFLLALEKKGVNYGAKVQQSAILRTAGVPLLKVTEKTGLPKIDKGVLESFGRHAAAKALLSFILVNSTINVYIEGEKRAGGSSKSEPIMVTEDGYLHPQWSIHKITGRWGSSPNCFDGDTEYLTKHGWEPARVYASEHTQLPKIAQFHPESGAIEFVHPTYIIDKHFTGEMIRLRRRNIDLLVTPDHRLYLGKRSGVWGDVPASEFAWDRKMLNAAEYAFGTKRVSDAEIAFICAAQADGNWNGFSGWTFGFTRPRKIARMRWLLDTLKLDYTKKTKTVSNPFGGTRKRTFFYIKKSAIGDRINKRLGSLKQFGKWLLDWRRECVETFLKEIMLWDGSFTRKNCYSSSTRVNADWIQTLLALTGRRGRIRSYTRSKLQKKVNWQVDVCDRKHTWTTGTEISRVPWNDRVYCVSVPSSYIIVRRNGNVMIVGQCQNWSKRAGGGAENLREMIEAPEGYLFVGADEKQLEARLIGAMSGCKFMLDTFQRGGDIHGALAGVGFPREWLQLGSIFKEHKATKMCWCKGCRGKHSHGRDDSKCHCPDCQMRDKIRDITKRLEYGFVYGGKAQTLWESVAKEFDWFTVRQTEEFIRQCNLTMPEVLRWREATYQEAVRHGGIRSPILGRWQFFPLMRVDPTVAYNFKAQSGGADLWALGALNFCAKWDQYDVDARIIHNGHDSVLILCREELAPQVEQDVYTCWDREWSGVPFEMEAKIAKRWSET